MSPCAKVCGSPICPFHLAVKTSSICNKVNRHPVQRPSVRDSSKIHKVQFKIITRANSEMICRRAFTANALTLAVFLPASRPMLHAF
jgi:hypothetical protein